MAHDVYLAGGTANQLWLVKDGRAARHDGDLKDCRKPLPGGGASLARRFQRG